MTSPVLPTGDPYAALLTLQRGAVEHSGLSLEKVLRWLRWLSILSGGLLAFSALAPWLGWRWVLSVLSGPERQDALALAPYITGLSPVMCALVLLSTWLGAVVINWCREYLSLLRRFTLAQADSAPLPAPARAQALRRVLSYSLTASQYALPLLLVLLVSLSFMLVPLGIQDTPSALLSTGFLWAVLALPLIAVSVINALILASLRQFLNGTARRMSGVTSGERLSPNATALSNWFVFCLVLLGISALNSLGGLLLPFSVPLLAASWQGSGVSATISAAMGLGLVGLGLLTLLLVALPLALQGLQFAALIYSRTFAVNCAAVLDSAPGAGRRYLGTPANTWTPKQGHIWPPAPQDSRANSKPGLSLHKEGQS